MALRHIFVKLRSKLNKIFKPRKRISDQQTIDKIELAIRFLEDEKQKIIDKIKAKEIIEEIIEEKPEEIEIIVFNRKIVKTLVYCPDEPHRAGFGHKLYALTYDDSDDDLFDELRNEILNSIAEEVEQGLDQRNFNFGENTGNLLNLNGFRNCLQVSEFGYNGELETTDPPFEFPLIEVGEEL